MPLSCAGLTPRRHCTAQELAASTPGFVNACVEFDIATLRPTYRLLWGSAGESNALAVAQGLGFSAAVVAEARKVRGVVGAWRPGSTEEPVLLSRPETQPRCACMCMVLHPSALYSLRLLHSACAVRRWLRSCGSSRRHCRSSRAARKPRPARSHFLNQTKIRY